MKSIYSAGARCERDAFRRYLRRLNKNEWDGTPMRSMLGKILVWVLARKKRYDKKPKGLGK